MGIVLAIYWLIFLYVIQISTVAIELLTFSTVLIFLRVGSPLFFQERIRV